MINYLWQDEIRKWCSSKADLALADRFIEFFRLAFTTAPEEAWFGYHRNRISLVVGNLWLAGIALSPKRVDLLVDEKPEVNRLEFISAISTASYTPLGWVVAKPWQNIAEIINSKKIWESYARACIKIFDSPISVPRTDYHYRNFGKVKLVEILSSLPKFRQHHSMATYIEGGAREITAELINRNPVLRAKAIDEYGNSCQVCGFNFANFYGDLGAGYIEVHHLKPLARRKIKHEIGIKDLAIVCANCHRVLHRKGRDPISLDELKEAIRKTRTP